MTETQNWNSCDQVLDVFTGGFLFLFLFLFSLSYQCLSFGVTPLFCHPSCQKEKQKLNKKQNKRKRKEKQKLEASYLPFSYLLYDAQSTLGRWKEIAIFYLKLETKIPFRLQWVYILACDNVCLSCIWLWVCVVLDVYNGRIAYKCERLTRGEIFASVYMQVHEERYYLNICINIDKYILYKYRYKYLSTCMHKYIHICICRYSGELLFISMYVFMFVYVLFIVYRTDTHVHIHKVFLSSINPLN